MPKGSFATTTEAFIEKQMTKVVQKDCQTWSKLLLFPAQAASPSDAVGVGSRPAEVNCLRRSITRRPLEKEFYPVDKRCQKAWIILIKRK